MKHRLDYAPHHIEAKRMLNELYESLKKNNYVVAEEILEQLIVELRMMRVAVKSNIVD